MKKIGIFVEPSCKGISGDALILCKRDIVDSINSIIEENSIVVFSLLSIDDSERTLLITINKFLEQIPNSFHVERTVLIRALIKIGLDIDLLNESAWINCFGSGTLQSSCGISAYKNLYMHERAALSFGPEFDLVDKSRVTKGLPLAMEDCPAWTETIWYKKYFSVRFKWEIPDPSYLYIDEWEGLGMVMNVSLPWIPKHKVLVAKLFSWNKKKKKFER